MRGSNKPSEFRGGYKIKANLETMIKVRHWNKFAPQLPNPFDIFQMTKPIPDYVGKFVRMVGSVAEVNSVLERSCVRSSYFVVTRGLENGKATGIVEFKLLEDAIRFQMANSESSDFYKSSKKRSNEM